MKSRFASMVPLVSLLLVELFVCVSSIWICTQAYAQLVEVKGAEEALLVEQNEFEREMVWYG